MATMLHPGDDAATPRPAMLTDRNRLALATLGAAGLLGVAGDLLVRDVEPGAGWAVALTLFLLALGALARMRGGFTTEQSLMLVPIVFLAESFAWRDAGALHFFNLVALLLSLSALSMSLASGGAWSVLTAGFRGLVLSCLHAAGTVIAGAGLLVLTDVDYRGMAVGGRARRLGAVGRGLLLTLPLLLVFGGLLMSADPVFERLVGNVFDVDLETAFVHLIAFGVFAWIAGGYLRGALLGAPIVRGGVSLPVSLGGVEVGMMLGALNALFLSFLVIQARYLFGGAQHLLKIAGLTAADYARSGFFELMFVAVLALPVLLVSYELLRKDERTLRAYRWLAGALAVQVGAMLLSAGSRMRLYVQGFGLTEERLYASAVMLWLATVFAAFFFTVLRGRAERLGGTALITGWLTLGALNASNPDVLIARVNIARMEQGRNVDGNHLGGLGAGAAPRALAALPRLSAHDQCMLAGRLVRRWGGADDAGWREWNKARSEARTLVQARRAELEQIGRTKERRTCPPSPEEAAEAAREAARPGAAALGWWESDPIRVFPGRLVRPLDVRAPDSVAAHARTDSLAALAVVNEWFDAVSFPLGERPDWGRVHDLFVGGEGAMLPPRSEVPAPGQMPRGMLRTPLRPSVRIVGDAAVATADYELRHARGEPAVATGEASFLLRRDASGRWRLTRAQWAPFGSNRSAPAAP